MKGCPNLPVVVTFLTGFLQKSRNSPDMPKPSLPTPPSLPPRSACLTSNNKSAVLCTLHYRCTPPVNSAGQGAVEKSCRPKIQHTWSIRLRVFPLQPVCWGCQLGYFFARSWKKYEGGDGWWSSRVNDCSPTTWKSAAVSRILRAPHFFAGSKQSEGKLKYYMN